MKSLNIMQEERDGAVIVHVGGEIDTGTVQRLTAALQAATADALARPSRVLVVELNDVTYFGSAGLNALLDSVEAGDGRGVAVRVVAANAEVIRPIEVTKLDEVLRPYPTVTDALTSSEGL
ncbi:anti-sigma factor antagonist [Mycobacterium sp. ITM-2016-00317]|uniref:anti-sigma factor antagonist n=1 Tax=Mycobacterium sp. ITM-2016-00317 TaxID=2099694 RepID=UPI000D489F40|nr:anti-sigma factor antagonist [Mycobacterium sp. ITM-2016-00317]WNG89237.1 anti-sigma factor antagonist [Mycobacterium sp. ITM-2016-00317]